MTGADHMRGQAGWWFAPLPLARVAVLRTAVYLFVVLDVLVVTPWVRAHGAVPGSLYQPVLIPRVLHLPTPTTAVVTTVEAVLVVSALVAATGRLPRLAGGLAAVAYTEWMFIAMSYGKIDHDRFALVVTLAVLPTVGPARWRDPRRDEAAGWALRSVQLAVVATYFLSAWAKMRWGGSGWANSEIFYWAMTRRGTWLGHQLLGVPWALHLMQWTVLVAEFSSPVLIVLRGRWQLLGVLFFASFHLATYLTITIHFLPHVICLLAFLPLERPLRRLGERLGEGRRRRRPADARSEPTAPEPTAPAPAPSASPAAQAAPQ